MKFLLLLPVFLLMTMMADAQKAKPKGKGATKKSASKGKVKGKKGGKIKTSGEDEYDLFLCYEGGGACTFTILKGDTLVYDVSKAGKNYQLFVIPNKFDAATVADFNWFTTGGDNSSGKVTVNGTGLLGATKYVTNLTAGDVKLTDASAIWLSEKNYKEIVNGKSSMSFDGSTPEPFFSPQADESNVTITYKDKQITLEGFALQNKDLGQAGRKEISVLNISSNLLMIKMDLDGTSMVIKEVRQNKSRK